MTTQSESSFSNTATSNFPKTWQKRFDLIEKAGGPKRKNIKALSFRERSKVNFNIIAFLFGPLYYLTKGMWKKAILISVAGILTVVILEVVLSAIDIKLAALNVLIPAWFATHANVDYYRKVVENDNGWW